MRKPVSGHIDVGYYIPNTKWELDLRYADYTRMEDSNWCVRQFAPEENSRYLGVQYHFNKKTRLTVNVTDREVEAHCIRCRCRCQMEIWMVLISVMQYS